MRANALMPLGEPLDTPNISSHASSIVPALRLRLGKSQQLLDSLPWNARWLMLPADASLVWNVGSPASWLTIFLPSRRQHAPAITVFRGGTKSLSVSSSPGILKPVLDGTSQASRTLCHTMLVMIYFYNNKNMIRLVLLGGSMLLRKAILASAILDWPVQVNGEKTGFHSLNAVLRLWRDPFWNTF